MGVQMVTDRIVATESTVDSRGRRREKGYTRGWVLHRHQTRPLLSCNDSEPTVDGNSSRRSCEVVQAGVVAHAFTPNTLAMARQLCQ
jgi:hypothetical protein